MITGLHVCKPQNQPYPGDVKTFVVIDNPATADKKGWTKIKSTPANMGGTPYEILSVEKTNYSDAHGNVSFNLEIEPRADGTQTSRSAPQTTQEPRQQAGGMTKDGYWERKEERDIEASQRMNRSHAQEMALRFFALSGGYPEGKTPTQALREMTDHFQRDSWLTAAKPEDEVPY